MEVRIIPPVCPNRWDYTVRILPSVWAIRIRIAQTGGSIWFCILPSNTGLYYQIEWENTKSLSYKVKVKISSQKRSHEPALKGVEYEKIDALKIRIKIKNSRQTYMKRL